MQFSNPTASSPTTSELATPTRARPFAKTQTQTPLWLRWLLGRELAPSYPEYQRAVAALQQGDQPMDDLVDWMMQSGTRDAKVLFEQALVHGHASISDCPAPLREFFIQVEQPPDWLDPQLLADGVRFMHGTGTTATYVLRDLALMGGYLLSGFNQSLVMTGALNNGTARRIAETGQWWIDCTEPDGLQPFAAGYRSTLHVRFIHALVRRNLAQKPEWDHAKWGLPLSQIDMVSTYLGFSVVMLAGLRALGIPITPRESAAVMHVWKYACWLMGVNACWLVDSEREGIVLLRHALMTQSQPDWSSRELAQALAQEPKQREYPQLQTLRRNLAYQQHLSMSRYFLGRKKMQQLGLPTDVTAWFPLLSTPLRFVHYSGRRVVPALRSQLEQQGRDAQQNALAAIFGAKPHGLIQPDAQHPAHVA